MDTIKITGLKAAALAAALEPLGISALELLSNAADVLRDRLRDRIREEAAKLIRPFMAPLFVLSNSPKANLIASMVEDDTITFRQLGADGPGQVVPVKDVATALAAQGYLIKSPDSLWIKGNDGKVTKVGSATLIAAAQLMTVCPDPALLDSESQSAHERARLLIRHAVTMGLDPHGMAQAEAAAQAAAQAEAAAQAAAQAEAAAQAAAQAETETAPAPDKGKGSK